MNILDSLGFPFKDSKWMIKMLVGGGLSFVALLPMGFLYMSGANGFVKVITTLLFLALLGAFLAPVGYAFRILQGACNAEEATLPEWSGWDVLFKEGLIVFGVCLVYGVIIALISSLISILSMRIPVLGSVFSLLQVVVGALTLMAGPYLAVALAKYAEKRDIISAFKFMDIIQELKSKLIQYLSASLMVLGAIEVIKVSFGLNLFQYRLLSRSYWMSGATFPLVSLLSPFVFFWLLLVVSRMYGLIYAQGRDQVQPQSEPEPSSNS